MDRHVFDQLQQLSDLYPWTTFALVVAWTAMYLTSYSDYLTCFHEPLLPPYLDVTLVGKMSSAITIPVSSGCSCAKERVKQQEKVGKGDKKGVRSLPIQPYCILHEHSCLISWIKKQTKKLTRSAISAFPNVTHFFSQNYGPATLFISCCCLHLSQVCLLPALNCV